MTIRFGSTTLIQLPPDDFEWSTDHDPEDSIELGSNSNNGEDFADAQQDISDLANQAMQLGDGSGDFFFDSIRDIR